MAAGGMRAIVRGQVQGVGFRAFVVREAERLGLSGWTRNLPDGSVEVVAAGEPVQLDVLTARLGHGPPLSRVESVDRAALDPPPQAAGFGIRF